MLIQMKQFHHQTIEFLILNPPQDSDSQNLVKTWSSQNVDNKNIGKNSSVTRNPEVRLEYIGL